MADVMFEVRREEGLTKGPGGELGELGHYNTTSVPAGSEEPELTCGSGAQSLGLVAWRT